VIHPDVLRKAIIKLRNRQFSNIGRNKRIDAADAAITQARAMIREDNYQDAIATLKSTLGELKDHPYLLLELARRLFEIYQQKPDLNVLNEARSYFKQSYIAGQRREILYVLWYETENAAKDFNNAIEIASLALQQGNFNQIEWLKRRASVRAQLSKSLERSLNIELAIDEMKEAAKDIGKAFNLANEVQKPPLEEVLSRFDDDLWNLLRKNYITEISAYKDLFDTAIVFIKYGDKRYVNFERITQTLKKSIDYLINKENASPGQINLLQNLFKQAHDCFKQESTQENQEYVKQNIENLEYEMKRLLEAFRK